MLWLVYAFLGVFLAVAIEVDHNFIAVGFELAMNSDCAWDAIVVGV